MSLAASGGVRIAELVGTLSYAADLGLGQPMDHCLRQTVIAGRLAELAGASDRDRSTTFYLGLLMNAYCHADAAEQATWFDDDIGFKSEGVETLGWNTAQILAFLVRRLASHGSSAARVKRLISYPLKGQRLVLGFMTTHAAMGARFAQRIGLDAAVGTAIGQAYEQWDGKGVPDQLSGEMIGLPARLVQLASPVEVFSRRHGNKAAVAMVRRNAGTQFDPALAEIFCANPTQVFDGVDEAADWDAVLAVEPEPCRKVSGRELDAVLEEMADLADLKSPYFAGHSRGVANLAAEAARGAGLPVEDQTTLRLAGLIHDLGRIGVSNAIWDKPRRLTAIELERVRLHPMLTDRMLARVDPLSVPRRIGARHHERLDGSGYPRGLTASALTPSDRLLAAADVYHAMTEPRPHRPALDGTAAAGELRAEVRAGRIDGASAAAVLKAAGHRAVARSWPAGLTSREIEVLGLVARGWSNKQIAQRLVLTPKTVSNHIEHVYAKVGVSSRAAATLYATQHGLLGTYETLQNPRTRPAASKDEANPS